MKHWTIHSALAAILVSIGCGDSTPGGVNDDPPSGYDTTGSGDVDQATGAGSSWQTDPRTVMNAVFEAARSKDYSKLAHLCDPKEEGDGDTRQLCSIAGAPQQMKEQFNAYFRQGQVLEEPVIVADTAFVRIMCGPQGVGDERFQLIRRDGKWYLYGF